MQFDFFGDLLGSGFGDLTGSLGSSTLDIGSDLGGLAAAAATAPSELGSTALSGGGLLGGAIPDLTGGGLLGAGTPATPSPQGFFSGLGSDLGSIARGAVPFVQLGTGLAGIGAAGLGAYNAAQQRALLAQAQKAQLQAAKPASEFAATALQRAEQGQLSPQQQAAIEQWKANAKARIRQYLAKAGLSSSTAAADWDRYIDQQALAMAASWIQQEAQLGIGATQAATGAAGGLARTAQMEGTGLSQSIQAANQAINSLAAIG